MRVSGGGSKRTATRHSGMQRTFELDQEVQGVLVRGRAFPDVGGQDRVGVVEQVPLLEVFPH